MESNITKDIALLTKIAKNEILATVKSIEVCKLCKSCSKLTFNYPVATLIEEIYTEYELSGMNNPNLGVKNPFHKAADPSRPVRSANRRPEPPLGARFRENPPDKEPKKATPPQANGAEPMPEKAEGSAKENLFNINKNTAFLKTPHILRSRGKKMSLNQGEFMQNNSDVLNREKSADPLQDRASSQSRPFTRQVPPTSSKERYSSERPAEEKLSEAEIMKKQLSLKVNSIKDQRLKELDNNLKMFEKPTRELITKIIECKYWIPVTFLIRLTYDQIEKNFPIEEAIDKTVNISDLPVFLEELKAALEAGKNLFSKSPYSLVTKRDEKHART
jgi:hypothetical protein